MSLVALKQPETGIFDGIPQKAYRRVDALYFSGLKHLDKSPAHFQEAILNPPEQTAAMRFGSAVHSAVLESGIAAGEVLSVDVSTRTTKAYKEFEAANPGKIILLQDEMDRVKAIVSALQSHPTVRALLQKGKAEQSVFWNDPETGVLCKCRPDYLRDDGIVIDLKTSSVGGASERGFQRAIMDYGYHWQSAWYLDGISQIMGKQLNQFVHIVVETEAPHAIGVFVLDDASLERARVDIRRLVGVYTDCLHSGEWPGYSQEIQNISLPSWAW